jgi:CRISPR-associated protein Cmr2
MSQYIYTAITFAPVQGFIEKSRKLRDLYGSSFLLSYLAESVCQKAKEHLGEDAVISPALLEVTQGTPNQIIVQGEYDQKTAREDFNQAWATVTRACQEWLENQCKKWIDEHYQQWVDLGLWKDTKNSRSRILPWQRDWEHWTSYAWEFFHATGETITKARQNLNEQKRSRGWTGINWIGESSTLSGADGVAYPGMGLWTGKRQINFVDFKQWNESKKQEEIKSFYDELIQIKAIESIFYENEQLSIAELIKRLITLKGESENNSKPMIFSRIVPVVPLRELPSNFCDLNRHENGLQKTGWFQGDGDKAGDYLKQIKNANDQDSEANELHQFSYAMRHWGEETLKNCIPKRSGRIIYAGGDDFLGVFYHTQEPELQAIECVNWFYQFPEIWQQHQQPITVSVGFVWAYPQVPQRDILQHCRKAEGSAKIHGRDRLALRILFNGGNYLEWVCPWRFLKEIFTRYQDRERQQNWGHFYSDIATLESRHAFSDESIDIAQAIFKIYFPDASINWENIYDDSPADWWNHKVSKLIDSKTIKVLQGGILGEKDSYLSENSDNSLDQKKVNRAINNWIINLAKVGFHLCQ